MPNVEARERRLEGLALLVSRKCGSLTKTSSFAALASLSRSPRSFCRGVRPGPTWAQHSRVVPRSRSPVPAGLRVRRVSPLGFPARDNLSFRGGSPIYFTSAERARLTSFDPPLRRLQDPTRIMPEKRRANGRNKPAGARGHGKDPEQTQMHSKAYY